MCKSSSIYVYLRLYATDTNRTRLVRKAKPAESFFNFFSPPKMPSDEEIENGDIDDEELEAVEEQVEMDYQIGEDLKEKVCTCVSAPQIYSINIHLDNSSCDRLLHWQSFRV